MLAQCWSLGTDFGRPHTLPLEFEAYVVEMDRDAGLQLVMSKKDMDSCRFNVGFQDRWQDSRFVPRQACIQYPEDRAPVFLSS